jgi:hypothetical protein
MYVWFAEKSGKKDDEEGTKRLKMTQKEDGNLFIFYVLYSTLLHLPPHRFHCVGGCWD